MTDLTREQIEALAQSLRANALKFENPPSVQSIRNINAINAMNEAADVLTSQADALAEAQAAQASVVERAGPMLDLVEEFVTATFHLLDNSETSGPKDDPTIAIWRHDFEQVSLLLDRCEGLPSGSPDHMTAGELLVANIRNALANPTGVKLLAELRQREANLALHAANLADQLAEARKREAGLVALIRWAHETLWELNPNNYDHDEVCKMNDAAVEVILGLAPVIGETHGYSAEWWSARTGKMRLETGMENIARDMAEGRFPERSEPKMVSDTAALSAAPTGQESNG